MPVTLARDAPSEIRARIAAVMLQAPVSDQESGTMDRSTEKWLAHAASVKEPAKELMPLAAHYGPITVERYLSLYARDGHQADDLFSSYLSDVQLEEKLGHLRGMPVLLAFSMADEYVPESVEKSALVDRLVKAMGPESARALKLQGASHSLDKPEDGSAIRLFVDAVTTMLKDLGMSSTGAGR